MNAVSLFLSLRIIQKIWHNPILLRYKQDYVGCPNLYKIPIDLESEYFPKCTYYKIEERNSRDKAKKIRTTETSFRTLGWMDKELERSYINYMCFLLFKGDDSTFLLKHLVILFNSLVQRVIPAKNASLRDVNERAIS